MHSVTQNLSDGLRAVVMSTVGREQFNLFRTKQELISTFVSWRNVLRFANFDDADACSGPSCITGCCMTNSNFIYPHTDNPKI